MVHARKGNGGGRPRRRLQRHDLIDIHGAEGGPSARAGLGSGVRWLGPSQILSQITRVVMALVLARLLAPEDFGIVALVTVVTGFFERVLGDTGTTAAIVRHKELSHGLASSVFFWNVLIGALTSGVFIVAAGPISSVLGDDGAADLLRVLGLMAVINSFGYVQRALLRRMLQFSRVAMVNYSNAFFTATATVAFAIADRGAWALVLGNLTGSAVSVVLAWVLSGWTPALVFSRAELRKISGFSANVSFQNIFGYFSFAGDRFVIGRFIGTVDLGFYGMATRLLRYPLQTSAQTYREVVFPALARMQDDDAAMLRTYRRTVNGIAFLLIPLCLTIAAVAHPLVRFTLGDRWEPAGILVAIMALVGAVQAVGTTTGSLYLTKGRPELYLRWQIASSIVLMISYSIGAQWGAAGVAWGFLAGVVLLTYPAFRIPLRLIGAKPGDVFNGLMPTLLAASLAAGAAGGVRTVLDGRADVVVLAASLAASVAVYGSYLAIGKPQAMRDLLDVLRDGRRRDRRPPTSNDAEPTES